MRGQQRSEFRGQSWCWEDATRQPLTTGQEPGRPGGLAKLEGTRTRTVPKSLKKEHSPVTPFRLLTCRLPENEAT